MRYFAEFSYKGTCYNGWQKQNNAPSVQQTMENALSTVLRCDTAVTGAGRTDTGVHAAYCVCHFDTFEPVPDRQKLIYHLNAVLPHDVAVKNIVPVSPESHARFDAIRREYRYFIATRKDPFRKDTAWMYLHDLDVDKMNEAAACLTAARDFTAFCKLHSGNKTNICSIAHASWTRCGHELVFTIAADRFLRNMVRSIVDTLVDVGRGKISAGYFSKILESRDNSLASGSAPAQGLFLTDVVYPPHIFNRTESKGSP